MGLTIHNGADNANLHTSVCRQQNKAMPLDLRPYLAIDDPLVRTTKLSAEIQNRYAEIKELGRVRTAAIIEAYENHTHPKEIAAAGGFNLSRLRQLFAEANYTPPFTWRHNSAATRFKPVSASSLSDEPTE